MLSSSKDVIVNQALWTRVVQRWLQFNQFNQFSAVWRVGGECVEHMWRLCAEYVERDCVCVENMWTLENVWQCVEYVWRVCGERVECVWKVCVESLWHHRRAAPLGGSPSNNTRPCWPQR